MVSALSNRQRSSNTDDESNSIYMPRQLRLRCLSSDGAPTVSRMPPQHHIDYLIADSSQDPTMEPNHSMTNNQTFDSNSTECRYHNCLDYYEYVDFIENYIKPLWYEWVFIAMHLLVFVVGILGNLLVCVSVYRNRSMRTVTNYFIVNLAAADCLVLLICLPPTVLWDVTETWFFGDVSCKLTIYFQVCIFIPLL